MEGVDGGIVEALRAANHEVFYIAESEPSVDDEYILNLANEKLAILITSDKDFGDLVFRLHRIHHGIILCRLEGLKSKTKTEIVLQIVTDHQNELVGSFTVISPGSVKIRKK